MGIIVTNFSRGKPFLAAKINMDQIFGLYLNFTQFMFFSFDSKFGLLASQPVRQRFGWHVIDSVIVSQGVS